MEKAGGKRERRRHPRFVVDLPFGYQIGDDPSLKGGVLVNASEGGFLIESVKAISPRTRLNVSVLFTKEFELADL